MWVRSQHETMLYNFVGFFINQANKEQIFGQIGENGSVQIGHYLTEYRAYNVFNELEKAVSEGCTFFKMPKE